MMKSCRSILLLPMANIKIKTGMRTRLRGARKMTLDEQLEKRDKGKKCV
jgi:hypothetical protein